MHKKPSFTRKDGFLLERYDDNEAFFAAFMF